MNRKLVYLTGFMGAGKSTIGPILANTLGWEFCDLDRIIEQHTGKKINRIFEEHGDQYFREIESEQLRKVSEGDERIISLGGGTVTWGSNLDFIKKNGQIIYLKISVESVYNRLIYKNDRPLMKINEAIGSKEEILNKINEMFRERKPYYEQADFIIETENVPVGKTVDLLAKIINTHHKDM